MNRHALGFARTQENDQLLPATGIVQEGTIASTRQALAGLLGCFPEPWVAGLEATLFSAWIYDHIRAQDGSVKMAHSMMLKAIAAACKQQRTPISKQRNKHLQTMLVEAAKLAPRWYPKLALIYEREKQRGNRNRATEGTNRRESGGVTGRLARHGL